MEQFHTPELGAKINGSNPPGISGSDKYLSATISGFSMYPTLRPGDKVFIKPGLRIGKFDIVVYDQNSKLIIHRVINIRSIGDRRLFTLKGDFDRTREIVREEQIIGKAVCFYRKTRFRFFTYETGFAYYLFVNMLSLGKAIILKAYYFIPGLRRRGSI
jgi:signal peptidase I